MLQNPPYLQLEEPPMMGIGSFMHAVPQISNAFLKKIDPLIADEEVRASCVQRFSRRGRPSYDPAAVLRIALLGQLLGLKSDRKTLEIIRENTAYRSFVAAPSMPHPSTLSRMRHRLGEDFFRMAFESSIKLASDRGRLRW
jgi:transposase